MKKVFLMLTALVTLAVMACMNKEVTSTEQVDSTITVPVTNPADTIIIS